MSPEVRPVPTRPTAGRFAIDLGPEAAGFLRDRWRVAGAGLAIGCAFLAVGLFEVSVFAPRGVSVDYALSLLLMVLGVAVAYVSLNSGLINPIRAIRGDDGTVAFDRRWGGRIVRKWTDPNLRLDIDDRRDDPSASDRERRRLFFEGPDGSYGCLSSSSLEATLSAARSRGAAVTDTVLVQPDRGAVRTVRRIRVRARPST